MRPRWGPGRLAAEATLAVLLALVLTACGKSGHAGPSGPSSGDLAYLFQHNARFGNGRTLRWANLPVRVFANGVAQEGEVTEWTRATAGAITFAFVGSASGADVTFGFARSGDLTADDCAATTVMFDTSGPLVSADVRVAPAIYRGPQCQRTVVHEMGHAIGFLDHTADGGLMDADGGNGEMTPAVSSMIRTLYALPPGTVVGSAETARAPLLRSGSRSAVTLVYHVRR